MATKQIANLSVLIGADTKGFDSGLQKVDSGLGGMVRGLGGVAVGAGLAFGAAGLGLLAAGVKGAMETELAIAKLDAVLVSTSKSTTMVRNAQGKMVPMLRSSKEELIANANALQKITMFSDDAVIETQTLLSTFTKVGRDVMPDATMAVLNMATVMGGDTKGAAVQLGKALNDPVEGISALTRVGVTFSDEQKKMIKQLMATGDIMGAQKIILAELNTEFGGAAVAAGDTLTGKLTILQNAFGDLLKGVGTSLLPAITGIVEGFTGAVTDIGELGLSGAISKWINEGVQWLRTEGPKLVNSALDSLMGAFGGGKQAGPPDMMHGMFDAAITPNSLLDKLGNLATVFGEWFGKGVDWIVANVPTLFGEALRTGLQFASDVGVWLQTNGPDIGHGIGVWIRGAIDKVIELGKGWVSNMWSSIFGGGAGNGASLSDTLREAAEPTTFELIGTALENVFKGAFATISGLVEGLFGLEGGTIQTTLNQLFGDPGVVKTILDKIFGPSGFFKTAIDRGAQFLGAITKAAIAAGQSLIGNLLSPFETLLKAITIVAHFAGNQELAQMAGEAALKIESWRSGQATQSANGRAFGNGGISWVGERGPELVSLPQGSRVIRSSRAQGMMGGSATVNITVMNQTDGYAIVEQIKRTLKAQNVNVEGLTG